MRSFLDRQRRRLAWTLRPRRNVPVGIFDAAANRWKDITVTGAVERDELTVATYNIWFDDYFANQRYQAIAELLSRDMPDVMVFQEVTPAALTVLLTQPWVRESYYRAAATGDDFGGYGMLLLSKMPVSHVTYAHLPGVGRGFLHAQLTVNKSPLVICSVHLASGKAASGLRARQLRRLFRALSTPEDVLTLGDFNMRDAENPRIVAPYRDIWPALRPTDDGFTEDTSVNLMCLDSKNKQKQVRFDRVLYKGTRWAPAAIELLGTEPISSALPRVFPSDHFGVLCHLAHRPVGR